MQISEFPNSHGGRGAFPSPAGEGYDGASFSLWGIALTVFNLANELFAELPYPEDPEL
jgi:hypothetical protein